MHSLSTTACSSLGLGIYSYAQAARLIGGDSRQLRRWVADGTERGDKVPRRTAPLWTSQLSCTGIDGISFRDLIELRFVHRFVAVGVPLAFVRRTLDELHERWPAPYPFTRTAFRTDGHRIFMELLDEADGKGLVDVVTRQNAFHAMIAPSLLAGIELSLDGQAARWFPLPDSNLVVIDPARRLGQPILASAGVPTIAVRQALKAEGGDIERVAAQFEVSTAEVLGAVVFEERFAA